MPTYDYECGACGHRFELFQSIKAAPTRKCPECGKLKVRRLLGTGAAVIFKGSGFYCTDYRDKSYHSAAKKDAPESSSSSDKGGSAEKASGGDKSGGEKASAPKADSPSKEKKK